MIRIFLLIAFFAFSATASGTARAEGFSDTQKKEIESLIQSYIMENPQVVLDSVEKHQMRQQEEAMAEQAAQAKDFAASLSGETLFPVAGNPDGDITVVEFFDYNCGYCKKAFADINTLIESDKNVRVLFVEMPILGPSSTEASKWALAAHKQGKYFEFHSALMNHQGTKNESSLEDLAAKIGLDVDKLKKDKDDPALTSATEDNIQKAQDLGISGTPGFIVGEEIVRGYVPYTQMESLLQEQRKAAQKKE